jgi:hypothetical protein
VEGDKYRQDVILSLRKRISSRHKYSLFSPTDPNAKPTPNYGVDDHLTDQKMQDNQMMLDDCLAQTCKLIEDYADIFASTPKSPGQTTATEHKITLKPGADLPKPQPMYRRTKPDRILIKDWINWMLKNNLIEKSNSPCAQNILVVHKPGKEPRVCIDPRPINAITQPDPYPMPRIDNIFGQLQGTEIFTALDAASGFFQVPLKKTDRWKAAFRCEQGCYQFTVMPFGLTNSPATFTRWMNETFEGLETFLKVYIDDLLIHSTVSQHAAHLEQVFMRCQKTSKR